MISRPTNAPPTKKEGNPRSRNIPDDTRTYFNPLWRKCKPPKMLLTIIARHNSIQIAAAAKVLRVYRYFGGSFAVPGGWSQAASYGTGMFRNVHNCPAAPGVRIPTNSPTGSRATISAGESCEAAIGNSEAHTLPLSNLHSIVNPVRMRVTSSAESCTRGKYSTARSGGWRNREPVVAV